MDDDQAYQRSRACSPLKVINSDEDADERPTFDETHLSEPSYGYPPKDLLTIFVAGNVLARGVAIEGQRPP